MPWTDDELEYLETHYSSTPVSVIASQLGRNENAVRQKACKIGISNKTIQNRTAWSPEEIERLRSIYPTSTYAELTVALNRGEMSIRDMVKQIGLPPKDNGRPWTTEEVEFLKHNVGTMSQYAIAKHLGRPQGGINSKIKSVLSPGAHEPPTKTKRRPWSSGDLETLAQLYPTTNADVIASKLNRSRHAIISKAQALGVKAIRCHHLPDNCADPVNSPYVTLSDPEKSYIAGIIDGEGHIEFSDRPDSAGKRVYLDVGNTNFEVIEWLERKCGGSVYDKVIKGNRKPAKVWRLNGPILTRHLLAAVLPYLIIKKEAAMEVINHPAGYTPP